MLGRLASAARAAGAIAESRPTAARTAEESRRRIRHLASRRRVIGPAARSAIDRRPRPPPALRAGALAELRPEPGGLVGGDAVDPRLDQPARHVGVVDRPDVELK